MTLNPTNQRAVIAGGAVWTLALLGCVGALAQSMSTRDPGAQLALQTLLNQGFEVKAATTAASGFQVLYLQKAGLLYACPLDTTGIVCSRIVSR
jgi:hypothetical protein